MGKRKWVTVVNDAKLMALFDCKSEAMANVKSQKAVERRKNEIIPSLLEKWKWAFSILFRRITSFPYRSGHSSYWRVFKRRQWGRRGWRRGGSIVFVTYRASKFGELRRIYKHVPWISRSTEENAGFRPQAYMTRLSLLTDIATGTTSTRGN